MRFFKINPLLEKETFEAFSKLIQGVATHGFSYYSIAQFFHGPVIYTVCQTHPDEWILTSHRRGDNTFDVYNIDFPEKFRINSIEHVPDTVTLVSMWDDFIEMLIEE